eukprot:CAMPEP_0113844172 /NCGR_PEP_ID=MMETSP0372-20130328/104_1 /TAXON_ID=340204 /ORGANISM="Lankesteria abbotti" /LENGTH=185 /DNA_ID=CAMNT_0000813175 /DNA_START=302 /DNA_END=856 /DNA_ORIENTATION=+ /assembly_acc=CAM_ASM_000359
MAAYVGPARGYSGHYFGNVNKSDETYFGNVNKSDETYFGNVNKSDETYFGNVNKSDETYFGNVKRSDELLSVRDAHHRRNDELLNNFNQLSNSLININQQPNSYNQCSDKWSMNGASPQAMRIGESTLHDDAEVDTDCHADHQCGDVDVDNNVDNYVVDNYVVDNYVVDNYVDVHVNGEETRKVW